MGWGKWGGCCAQEPLQALISLSAGRTSVCKTLSGLQLSAVGAGGEAELPRTAGTWKEPSLQA